MWKKLIHHRSKKTQVPEKKSNEESIEEVYPKLSTIKNNRLLICDDAFGNRLVLKRYFKRYGYEFDEAQNGKEAIDMVVEHGEYAIIWIDVKMPIMNGIECTRYLRQHGYQGIIIGITGFTDQNITSDCIDAGMTHVMTKPITREVILTFLDTYIPKTC